MTSLDKFPPLPHPGKLTLCEVEGKIHSMDAEQANLSKYTSALSNYPKIAITSEVLHHAPAPKDESGRVFMPVADIFFKRIVSAWYERGFLEAVKVAACLRPGEGPRFAVILADFVLRSINVLSRVTNKIYPCLRESGNKLIEAVSQTREWSVSPIRCIEWHPHANKLAVAAKDDSVRIYSTDTLLIPVLKCKSQSNVTCLAWRPFSASELAVGCETGVILWTVDPNSVVTRPSMSSGLILKQSGHSPVTSIVWAPQGDLILTASAADTSMYLWDVAMERNVPLKRVGGGGVCLVLWSPDSSKLFASTAGVIFRVWNTDKWIPERWTVLSGRVQTACWSPCGSVVLFATTEEPVIYALPFHALGSVFQSDDFCNVNPVIDLTPVESDTVEDRIGGLVTSMCWDKRGHHLAVMFKESSIIAVFRTEIKSVLKITPCCFINGLLGEVPTTINFQKNFTEGAVLTIAWSTGRLQHFPFIYSDLELDQNSGFRALSVSVLVEPRMRQTQFENLSQHFADLKVWTSPALRLSPFVFGKSSAQGNFIHWAHPWVTWMTPRALSR